VASHLIRLHSSATPFKISQHTANVLSFKMLQDMMWVNVLLLPLLFAGSVVM
jgi:hypothetical protein